MILELLTNSLWIYLVLIFIAIGTIYSLTKAGPLRKYDTNLQGKVVVITGSSAGVGKATALKLASRNATLVFACRNQEKTSQIIEQIKKETRNGNLHFIQLELSDYDSIRRFVKTFQSQFVTCDILINNAGIFKIDKQFNKCGHELTYATNHLGHFLLTNLMLPLMSKQSRIINVASGAHTFLRTVPDFEKSQSGLFGVGMTQYSTTKFCNILFTQALAEKLENQPIKVVSLHPGFVRSEIYTEKNGANKYLSYIARIAIDIFMRQFSLTEEEGARTTEYCALQEYENLVNGGYYEKNNLSKASNLVRKCGKEQHLWNLSMKAVNVQ